MPSTIVANRNNTTLFKNQSAIKYLFNAFPLKFRVRNTFYALRQFWASARFQLIV